MSVSGVVTVVIVAVMVRVGRWNRDARSAILSPPMCV
jgi:hypothetical protein